MEETNQVEVNMSKTRGPKKILVIVILVIAVVLGGIYLEEFAKPKPGFGKNSPAESADRFIAAFATQDWKTMDKLSSKNLLKTLPLTKMQEAVDTFGRATEYKTLTASTTESLADMCGQFNIATTTYALNTSLVLEDGVWKIDGFNTQIGGLCN